ncbi:MAG: LptF/LptG family permease, partial [Candidatus Aminicenantes bacterium]|nr:LptF/LptG family permease [Candidatus Aminicenantes bacterium]
MKVLDRYFLKEIIPSFLLALSFIIFLLFMNQVFYLAEIFISKNVPFLIVLKVLFYLLPSIIALAFPLAFMAGVLGGLARLSSDREIDALKVLGFTPGKILKPLFVLGLVFWLITTGFTFWLTPAANYRWLQTMVNSVLTRISLAVEPGLFIESLPGKVIFIQGKERDETWRNVFVYQLKEDDKFQITLSRTGQLSLAPEKKEAWLYLEDGQNYGFDLKLPEVVLVNSFQKLVQAVDLSRITRNSSLEKKGREKNIKELLEDRIRGKQEASTKPELFRLTEVELHKRLSLPATCLIFVFLGAGLGWRKWRGGRLTGYALSVVILLVYYGLLVVGEEAAMKGKLSPALAMWCPNLLILISGLFFYFTSYRVESGRVQKIYYQIKEIKTRWLRK